MKISLKWLKELVDYEMPAPALAKRLNGAGLEVAGIHVYGNPTLANGLTLPTGHLSWDNIIVGQVLEVKAHPNADRLRIASVDYGQGPMQSVTGAPNIAVGSSGQRVAVATQGAQIANAYGDEPSPAPVKVKPAKLRGERSEIVLCSDRELGISENHEGILLLDPDAPLGMPLSEVLGDVVLEVEITPNLARCLNMVGVAREVAALAGGKLKIQEPTWQDTGNPIEGQVKIEIEDPARCSRYTAALIQGIRIKPSPYWMKHRLTLAGMRPINNVVDITNYAMLEWGQPLHAFDHRTLQPRAGEKTPYILVRKAKPGETLRTLDGVERALDPDMLLITDGRGPIALAGVMGGAQTEVSERTMDILLESANFDYAGNRRTSQRLKLFSEASGRFSKGLPSQLTEHGLKRAAELMRQLAGGTITRGFVDVYPQKPKQAVVRLPAAEPARLLGVDLTMDQATRLLEPMGYTCRPEADALSVEVPYYRLDVSRPADLVEDIARMLDYDKLPTRLLRDALPPQQGHRPLELKLRTKAILAQLGLQEVINYTLTNPKAVQQFDPLRRAVNPADYLELANTLSSERTILRQSLLPTMLETLQRNARAQGRVSVFEVGHVYLPKGEPLPKEPSHLGILMWGLREDVSWLQQQGQLEFFDLKGIIEKLVAGLGIQGAQHCPNHHPSFHPGRCASLQMGADDIGVYGELHPQVAAAFDVQGRVCAAEFNLDLLLTHVPAAQAYTPLPRFPAVMQDIALILDRQVPSDQVQALILELGQPLLTRAHLFDVYTGEHVPAGKRSLAYALTYQAPDRTLTDEEVSQLHRKIQQGLQEKLGAEIRGLT